MCARWGAWRNSWAIIAVRPAREAAPAISAASRASSANGFSQSTCFPDATAESTISRWGAGGVAIATASRSRRSTRSRQSPSHATTPAPRAASRVRS